ncbi:MAG: hypothetical protein KAI47_04515 [Deltaproteobacteria bacterium]|nr:hypothetical protein [Deltaproteobacteria bacterium]
MRRLTILCACCLTIALLPAGSHAEGEAKQEKSYEKLQAKSVGVYDARAILLPFVKTCDREKTSFRKLFCEALNDRLKSQHQAKTYEQTFEPSPEGPLVLSFHKVGGKHKEPRFSIGFLGCLTCRKPMLNRVGGDISKARFFVFRQPKTIRVRRGGTFDLVDIKTDGVTVPIKVDELDEQPWTTKRFQRDIGDHIRLDAIYRPVAGVTRIGGRFKYGVLNFELLGYRIYNKCTGQIYRAKPKMAGKFKVDKNDLSCPQNRPDWGNKRKYLPPRLPQGEVKALMVLLEADMHTCYDQFGQTGTYPVDITILGTGRVKGVAILGKMAGTPTAECVKRIIKNVRFPAFSGRKLHMPWQFKIDKK